MPLLNLPNELLEVVGDALDCEKDYAALASTNRRLHDIVLPLLYRFNRFERIYSGSAEHWAISKGRVDVLQRVYDFGLQSNSRETFFDAVDEGHVNILEFLFNSESGDNKPEPEELIHFATHSVDVVRYLLEQGVPVDARNEFGETPLFSASLDSMRVLLENGADVNARSFDGSTPLMKMAKPRTIKRAQFLIEQGADVNARELDDHRTTLHQAATRGNVEVINLLRNNGADLFLKDSEGKTALHCASVRQNIDAIKALYEPSLLGNYDMVDKSMRWTPLHEAVITGNSDAARLFVESKSVWTNQRDINGRTPIFYAGKYGQLTILNDLLAHGANLNTKDKFGATPIFVAVRNEQKEIVLRLLEYKSDSLGVRDAFGHTIVWWAKRCGNAELVDILTAYADKLGYSIDAKEFEATESVIKHNLPWCWCDICTRPIGGRRTGHMCPSCCDGHFVICNDCFVDGTLTCEESHREEKWVPYDTCRCPIFNEP